MSRLTRPSRDPEAAATRRRGRPAEFDRDAALDAALRVFWLHGYAASLDVLTEAMDLNRPSLYGAFGSKQQLYAAAVAHYVAKIGANYLAPLAQPSLPAALAGFYAAVIDGITGRYGPRGCIVACTLPAEAGVSDDARKLLATVLAELDAAVVARVEAAQRAGELPRGRDPRLVAQVITGGMFALSIRARAGASARALRALARELSRGILTN